MTGECPSTRVVSGCRSPLRLLAVLTVLLLSFLAVALPGCDRGDTNKAAPSAPSSGSPTPADPLPPSSEPTVDLLFTYGSEKKAWIADVTAAFNAAGVKTGGGKRVRVQAVPMGSGESVTEILEGRSQAHLTSPASAAYLAIGNADSRAKTGGDLVGDTRDLVLSPVVIAMWKPMAEALGWPGKPVGWAEVLALARDPKGWASHGNPQWGRFRFGHTHPEYSNSGLISVLAECYAAAGKQRGLTTADLARPEVGAFLGDIEAAVVHYGDSTGFFADRMFASGPGYLSAAVLYESSVIESYGKPNLPFPVVAIYPKEGTFWSDHPVAVVKRPWVTDEHREAADKYIAHLLEPAQQQKAMAYGFRPGDPSIAPAAPIDAAHGVDPREPRTTLEVPPADVMAGAIDLWRKHKKHADVVLVFDTSGSMKEEDRMPHAKAGALQLLDLLAPEDRVSLLPFSSGFNWAGQDLRVADHRERLKQTVNGLYPDGSTFLYDSIGEAYQHLTKNAKPDRISAIVVLTDGDDQTSQRLTLAKLKDLIRADGERSSVRIFTIAYGGSAKRDVLKDIAEATKAKSYAGTPQNIRAVFKEIATFF